MRPQGVWAIAAAGGTFTGSVLAALALAVWLGGARHQEYILIGLGAGILVGGYSAYRLVASALSS
jgi:hypothetical protein